MAVLNINEVQKRIKQRPPFQMIEKVLELEDGHAIGVKNVSINESYFMGHFPDSPIMPGVLIVEAAAQLCSLTIESDGSDENLIYVLLKVEDFKFIKPVIPGDTLQIEVTKDPSSSAALVKFDAKITVDGQIRAKGRMAFTSMPKSAVYQ